ncbi:GNAT family acetyltransferase [Salinibacterium sp. NK8237]|uniref:GNAT family acetyltransferase n=1 Tax=Salinibacterium sp. NK8237 TaxID=2792038 RepID=UPI0018CD3106|nr:GNAT family acetyltransferase [Salinibacterium sp. NK8237]MBH0130062.1 GNAT family acetyltransferase [Salinibacterium sp. NK8237]
MNIRTLTSAEFDATAALWESAGLTRPWNPPQRDFDRALAGATSTILGAFDGDAVTGTVMAGHDGHRGWVYYLAVADSSRESGVGRALMDAAEEWLHEQGAVKVQLMVRSTNKQATGFYEHLGYEDADVRVLAKWLR